MCSYFWLILFKISINTDACLCTVQWFSISIFSIGPDSVMICFCFDHLYLHLTLQTVVGLYLNLKLEISSAGHSFHLSHFYCRCNSICIPLEWIINEFCFVYFAKEFRQAIVYCPVDRFFSFSTLFSSPQACSLVSMASCAMNW